MTTREVSEAYRLTDRTLREWRRQGRLPFVRIGSRSIRFRAGDVDAAMKAAHGRDETGDTTADAVGNAR